MNNNIYISIPDFQRHFKLNIKFIQLYKTCRHYFYDNIIIDSCYGSFPTIFNGGRLILGYTTYSKIQEIIEAFNQAGISIRHTFTNQCVTENDLNDKTFNTILNISKEIGEKYKISNGVNIYHDFVKDYIEKNYPSIYTMYSTTIGIQTIDDINKYSENHILIPNQSVNKNFDLLSQLNNPQNIELLTADPCKENCIYKKWHYQAVSQTQYLEPPTDKLGTFKCPYNCEVNLYYYDHVTPKQHHITYDQMVNNYLPLGINKFKISGRGDNFINVIERYVTLLIKPEYKDKVRNILLNICFN